MKRKNYTHKFVLAIFVISFVASCESSEEFASPSIGSQIQDRDQSNPQEKKTETEEVAVTPTPITGTYLYMVADRSEADRGIYEINARLADETTRKLVSLNTIASDWQWYTRDPSGSDGELFDKRLQIFDSGDWHAKLVVEGSPGATLEDFVLNLELVIEIKSLTSGKKESQRSTVVQSEIIGSFSANQFSGVASPTTYGAISLSRFLPQDISSVQKVELHRASGTVAPGDCFSSSAIQTITNFEEETFADLGLATNGDFYSYRLCIYDTSNNLIASQTATSIVPKSCGGVVVSNYCWYQSEMGEGCRDVCENRNGLTNGHRVFAGSDLTGGSLANCDAVLDALLGPGDTIDVISQFSTAMGCGFLGDRVRVNNNVTDDDTIPLTGWRACSCRD